VVVFYEYGPYLFAWCASILMFVPLCKLGAFQVYQFGDLCFYMFTYLLYGLAIAMFPLSGFGPFIYFMAIGLEALLLFALFGTVCSWRNDREGEMFKKTFELEERTESQASGSEDELMNERVMEGDPQEEPMVPINEPEVDRKKVSKMSRFSSIKPMNEAALPLESSIGEVGRNSPVLGG
jgi:hypothetical protein